jgi:hypothetical protein
MKLLSQYLEIAFVLILVYLILSHGPAFTSAVNAISGLNNGAIKNLQGRG